MENKFETALKSTLANETTCTENGAIAFATSGHALVDLNFAMSSFRGKNADEIQAAYADAYVENPLLAVKWLFFARDIRGGAGERRLFRICFAWLANKDPELVKRLIPLVAEYGRFDDLFYSGLEGNLWDSVVDFVAAHLKSDLGSEHPSLLAKWLPSVNTSSFKTRTLAKKLYMALGMKEKQYRKALSKLRAKLKVLEVATSSNHWAEIDYNTVPSKANLKYKDAFLKHDHDRRAKYLEDLSKPESKAKINSAAAFPCDIVSKYYGSSPWSTSQTQIDTALEAMWKALPDYVAGNKDGSTLCVVDTSGSMTANIFGSSMTAMQVAYSLGIYFSEKLSGPFKDKVISFSDRPKYISFEQGKSLLDKIRTLERHSECANTDLKKTFMLVLKTAVDNNLKQEDLPSTLLILSDMQFDQGTYVYSNGYDADKTSLMAEISAEFAKHGYHLPRLVYWNICGGIDRSCPIPIQQNEAGVVLMSGFSAALAKMAFSAKIDPYDALVDSLNAERYEAVEKAFNG